MFPTIQSLFRKSMVFKLRLTNSIIIFISYIVVAAVVSLVYHSIMEMREKQIMEVYLKNTLGSVDNKIKDFSRISLVAFSDDITLDILQNTDSYTFTQKLNSLEYLHSLYTKLISIRNDIRGVYLFNEDQLVFYQNTTDHVVRTNYPIKNYIEGLWAIEAQPSYGTANHRMKITTQPEFLLEKTISDPFDDLFEFHCITIIREIRTFYPNRRIGHIVLTAPVSILRETLSEFLEAHFSYLLFDREGTIIFSESGDELGKNLADLRPDLGEAFSGEGGIFRGTYNGKESIIAWKKSPYSGITLLTVTPLFYIYRTTLFFIAILSAIFAVAVAVVLFLTGKFTRTIIDPIQDLSKAMANFSRDNIQEELSVNSEDEVGQLTGTFNTMKKTINELIFAEYENKIRLRTLQLQQKEAQLKNLQGQINPHFLYNTLENIRVKAALKGDREVSDMIMLLVDFFRGNMGASSSLVPIKKEMHLIKVYLSLMQYRYPNLQSEFQIDEDLLSIEMPSFILQPIVENSLIHGLKSVNYNGKINISLLRDKENPEFIIIKIADNGIGFDEKSRKLIDKLLNSPETVSPKDDGHIGITNVNERLKLFYYGDCGLNFEINPAGGVTAIIKIKEQVDNLGFAQMKINTAALDVAVKNA